MPPIKPQNPQKETEEKNMGWAKYDEDNRDAIEERWATRANTRYSSVCNYTTAVRPTSTDTGYIYRATPTADIYTLYMQHTSKKGWK